MEALCSPWNRLLLSSPITFSPAGSPTHSCWEEPGCIFFHLSARRKPIQRGKLSEGRLEVLIWSLSRRLLRPPLLQMVLSQPCRVASSCCAKIEPQFTKVHGGLSRRNAISDISIREEIALDYCPDSSRGGALSSGEVKNGRPEWTRPVFSLLNVPTNGNFHSIASLKIIIDTQCFVFFFLFTPLPECFCTREKKKNHIMRKMNALERRSRLKRSFCHSSALT